MLVRLVSAIAFFTEITGNRKNLENVSDIHELLFCDQGLNSRASESSKRLLTLQVVTKELVNRLIIAC